MRGTLLQCHVFYRRTKKLLESFQKRTFEAPLADGTPIAHDVYSKGDSSACVVIIQELPGIGPETISLANTFVEQGFRVVLPHLFGPLGRIAIATNTVRVFCMRREFTLFTSNRSSPIVDWLKALCRNLRSEQGASAVGVIGMCLTGNFALAMMMEPSLLAPVLSQPSLPFPLGAERRATRGQPVGLAGREARGGPQGHGAAAQQRAHDRLGGFGIAQHEAGGRIVERQIEADVARGGDRSVAAQGPGHLRGQAVGAAMAAQQGHRDAAVLGDRHDRRLAALVGQQRCQQPDHDAGGAQGQDRLAGPVEAAQATRQIVVGHLHGR